MLDCLRQRHPPILPPVPQQALVHKSDGPQVELGRSLEGLPAARSGFLPAQEVNT